MPAPDVIGGRPQPDVSLILLPCGALTAEAAKSAEATKRAVAVRCAAKRPAAISIAAGGACPAIPEASALLVLDLLGIVDIGIRVVLPAQLPVRFLDLIIGGSPRNPQHFIRISH